MAKLTPVFSLDESEVPSYVINADIMQKIMKLLQK
jgi:hypothetical protein